MTLLFLLLGFLQVAPTDPPASQVATSPTQESNLKEFSSIANTLLVRLEELDRKTESIKDLSADFEQKKFTTLLKAPLTSSGRLQLKGTTIRWNTSAPAVSVLAMTPGEIRVFDPAENSVEVFEATGDLRELTGSPLPRLKDLLPHFNLVSMSPSVLDIDEKNLDSATARFVGIELTPKSDELKAHVTKVRVVIDSTIPSLVKMEISDADGDRTVLTLENIKINSGLTDEDVVLKIPDDARVMRPLKAAWSVPRPASEAPKKDQSTK